MDICGLRPARAAAFLLSCGVALFFASAAQAASGNTQPEVVARLQMAIGHVERSSARGATERVSKGAKLHAGDTISTRVASYAYLVLADGSQVFVRPASQLQLEEPGPSVARGIESAGSEPGAEAQAEGRPGLLVGMLRGAFRLISATLDPAASRTAYQTPVATIGIRGTEFEVTVAEDETSTVFVLAGAIDVANPALPDAGQRVAAGQFTIVRPGRAPTPADSFETDDIETDGLELSADLERIEDPALDAAEAPADARYLAFAEPYLDFRRNPAYSVQSGGGLTRLSLSGSSGRHSSALSDDNGLEARSRNTSGGWLGQGVVIKRVRPNVWLGGYGATRRESARLLDLDSEPQSTIEPIDNKSELRRNRLGLALAGQSERLALGLSTEFEESDFEFNDELDGRRAASDNAISGGKLGALYDAGSGATLGFAYRHARLRSRGGSGPVATRLSGRLNEIDLLYRRALSRRTSFGASLRLEESRSSETARDAASGESTSEPDKTTSLKAAAGMGWTLADGSLVSLDLALGLSEKTETLLDSAGQAIESGRDEAWNVGLHLGAQIRVHGPLLLSFDASSLYLRSDERSEEGLGSVDAVTIREQSGEYVTGLSMGLGVQRGPWTFGYLASASTRVDGALRHSLYLIAAW